MTTLVVIRKISHQFERHCKVNIFKMFNTILVRINIGITFEKQYNFGSCTFEHTVAY